MADKRHEIPDDEHHKPDRRIRRQDATLKAANTFARVWVLLLGGMGTLLGVGLCFGALFQADDLGGIVRLILFGIGASIAWSGWSHLRDVLH